VRSPYAGGAGVDAMCATLYSGGFGGMPLFGGGAGGDALCALRTLEAAKGGLCLLEVPEAMRCVLLRILEAAEGRLCLLEVLQVPEVMHCVLDTLYALRVGSVAVSKFPLRQFSRHGSPPCVCRSRNKAERRGMSSVMP